MKINNHNGFKSSSTIIKILHGVLFVQIIYLQKN